MTAEPQVLRVQTEINPLAQIRGDRYASSAPAHTPPPIPKYCVWQTHARLLCGAKSYAYRAYILCGQERNLREQRRSNQISQQIEQLKEILNQSGYSGIGRVCSLFPIPDPLP